MIKLSLLAVTVLSYLASADQTRPANWPSYLNWYEISDAPSLFEKFQKQFLKFYVSDKDRQRHYETFVKNLQDINEKNRKHFEKGQQWAAYFSITPFTDLTLEEFNGHKSPIIQESDEHYEYVYSDNKK